MVNKKVSSKGQSLEMTASQKISNWVADNVVAEGKPTMSVKMTNRVMKGNGAAESHLEFIMRVLGKLRSDSNGSFSITLPRDLSDDQTQKLSNACRNVHGEMEYILNTVYQMLPEEERSRGKEIQMQNALRKLMIGKLTDVADAPNRVENYLKSNGLLYIPSGAYMELKIVGGAMVFMEPEGGFWREGPEVVVDDRKVPTYVANWDLYGRTRLPLSTDDIADFALNGVFGLAKSFEEFWSKKEIKSSDYILDNFATWTETLEHKSTEVVRNALTTEEMDLIEKDAESHVSKMMCW